MDNLIIKRENVIAAYQDASNEQKKLLRALFPEADFEAGAQPEGYVRQRDSSIPIEERIYTFEDACAWHGLDAQALESLWREQHMMTDEVAYQKLRLIVSALNEGWEPEFTQEEIRWYPWHYLWTAEELVGKDEDWKKRKALISVEAYKQEGWAGFACAYSDDAPSAAGANVGSRLCLKSEALSDLAATRFIALWADFKLIRRVEPAYPEKPEDEK